MLPTPAFGTPAVTGHVLHHIIECCSCLRVLFAGALLLWDKVGSGNPPCELGRQAENDPAFPGLPARQGKKKEEKQRNKLMCLAVL